MPKRQMGLSRKHVKSVPESLLTLIQTSDYSPKRQIHSPTIKLFK